MNSDDEPKQYCPICRTEVTPNNRYPDYLCQECADRITDKGGRRVDFFNDACMGFVCAGAYLDTNEPYTSDHCFVDGVECYASEVRFGGIVIRPCKAGPEARV